MPVTIRGLFLNSSNEAVTDPSPNDDNGDAENLKDRHPPKIKKTIANCRYAFDNDPTVRGIILNNAYTANNTFRIVSDDKNAETYITQKSQEWDLDTLMTNTLIKVMRDGPCFIEKGIIDRSIKVRFLAYDNDKYKMKVIRNPKTAEIMGYKQKRMEAKNIDNWKSTKFDKIDNDMVEVESNYSTDQIIYPVLLEEQGKPKSLLMPLLEHIDTKWTLERFMISTAHKSGNLIGITVGDEKTDNTNIPKSFINKLIETFRRPVEKDVAILPHGVSADVIGNNQLSDLPSYLKYFRNEIFLNLQTPESLFSTESSNRATAEIQADDDTGYKVFINFLRFFLKKYFERELIDHELRLRGMTSAIGKVKIEFDVDETPKPLEDNNETDEIPEDAELDKEDIGE